MAEVKRNATLVARYERTRAQVRANQVVDVAEDILGHAWVEHLAALRREVTATVRDACDSAEAARRLLQHAEADRDDREIATARRLVGRARSELVENLDEARRELAAIDARLQRVHRAALDRLGRRRTDLERLQAAYAAAFGDDEP